MITTHGDIAVPDSLVKYADEIKMENYKTNTPATFHKHAGLAIEDDVAFRESLSLIMHIPSKRLDYVFFSVCQGAEPHCDQLNPDKFSDTTYIIPVIVPDGSVITAEDDAAVVSVGEVYSFDHTKVHSMTVGDNTGCVVIMAVELIGDITDGVN